MLRRLVHAVFYEILACLILVGCTLFITSLGASAPLWILMSIGLGALTVWSLISVYAILVGANLIGP